MKKQLLLLVMMLLPMVASADKSGTCGANLIWTLVESTGTLTISGSGAMKDYSYYVNLAPWYYERAKILTVVLEDGVTSIGKDAFYECSSLTSVTIGNSVTSIGVEAFWECTSLTSITIPTSVTNIGGAAFLDCSGLTSIIVESGNTKYDSRNNCNAIIETTSNTLIAGCQNTTIPNSVTSIGSNAFIGCSGLTSITIPGSVTSIGSWAFEHCSGLTSITIPNSVTNIGGGAFCCCNGLTSITIGNSVTSIGESAFSYCSGLTSVTIPNSVTSIGNYAFDRCSLTSITIPNSVKSIGSCAFAGCSSLTSIIVESGNTKYDSRNNCNAIIETTSNTLIAGCKNTTIPNSVTSIGSYAFSYCRGLTSITIPGSVKSIGDYAFDGCSGLTSITIPGSVKSIGGVAFRYCSDLLDMYCYAENVPKTGSDVFRPSNISNATLHVPDASINLYKTTEPWKNFKKIVALTDIDPNPSGIVTIGLSDNEKTNFYDLNGRKVEQPTKGLYIKNGKKVVVK